ncbi:SRPBCC family protein [Reyranella sp.]|uniref:SRPBCC family protein n=1 Tax=Reyranella sp. TaxID=1929291 RepID=UPI003BA8F9C1
MLRTLAIFVGLIIAVVAGIVIYAATKPDTFRVQRTVEIKASPAKILPLIDDLKAWPTWSPYEKKDPGMKRSYGAVTKGKGATYAWDGNEHVGQGHMKILEETPDKVVIKLDFEKPFEAHNTAEFLLRPQGDATSVTWAIYGPSPLVSRVMGLFMDMDRMIGRDFEQGLADLKAIAEK